MGRFDGVRTFWTGGVTDVSARERAVWTLVFALLAAASLGLVALVEIPAMVDYPNHLARMSILARAGTPLAHPLYEVAWTLSPNLAMDVLVPWAAGIMSVETATRLFLVLSQVLVLAGVYALERTVKGRAGIGVPVAVLFLFCVPFAWGFLNFQFGTGLALLGIAAWIAGEGRPVRRAVIHTAFVAALFAAHFFALGIYGFTLGLLELWRVLSGRTSPRRFAATLAVLAAPACAALALMIAAGGGGLEPVTRWGGEFKGLWLARAMSGYDAVSGIAALILLAGAVLIHGRRGTLERAGPAGLLATGFACLYVVMPVYLLDTAFVDVRVIVAAALIIPAFLGVGRLPVRHRAALGAALALLTTIHLAGVARLWLDYDAEYRSLAQAMRGIPPQSRILAAHGADAPDPPPDWADYPMYHAPVLAVAWVDALVPTLFTYPGKQPVSARADLRRLDTPQGGPVPVSVLAALAERGPDPAFPAHLQRWTRDFDYVVVVGPKEADPLPGRLTRLAQGRRFGLFAVVREP